MQKYRTSVWLQRCLVSTPPLTDGVGTGAEQTQAEKALRPHSRGGPLEDINTEF